MARRIYISVAFVKIPCSCAASPFLSCKMAIQFAKLESLDCTDPACSKDYTAGGVSIPSSSSTPATPQPPPLQHQYPGTHGVDGHGAVLLVNHLDERVKPQELFNLFGTCGDVMKVKILFNKRDSALLEFRNPAQAKAAKVCTCRFGQFEVGQQVSCLTERDGG